MICIICTKSDKEFTGQRKVCIECKINLINNNSIKQCEYCGESKDKKLFSKTKQGIVCKWNWKNLAPLEAKANASKANKINITLIEYYKNRVFEYLKIYGEGSESIR